MNFLEQIRTLLGGAGDFRFAAPYFLFALIALPFLFALFRYRERHRSGTLLFSNIKLLKMAGVRQSQVWRNLLMLLRLVALGLLLLAMARPQYGRVEKQTYSEGIDIALVLDVSLSMRAADFYPNRLEAAKEVIQEFVAGRVGDRIGLVLFGSEAVTLVPMTLDYAVVRQFIDRVRFNLVDGNSTAIGVGIATALNKLKESEAKSKVIILLTDGENNAGKIDPLTAAEAAKALEIRIYTIGVGSERPPGGMFGMPQDGGIDEEMLTKIADETGGLYFRATDREKLESIYGQIDKLEKSRVESVQFDNYNDLASLLILPALGLVLIELLLRATRFLKVP